MINTYVKLNNGEWSNDVNNKDYKKVIELNKNLKEFMKEVLEIELQYKEFCEMLDPPKIATPFWTIIRKRRSDEIDRLFYPTEEAVKKAYEDAKSEMYMFKQLKQNKINSIYDED
jgi:hypothetical protein